MRIATYNIWNENKGPGGRFDQLIDEIRGLGADIIGLQEVSPAFCQSCLPKTGYPYWEYRQYAGEEEGLAILCRQPIQECTFLQPLAEYGHSAALHILTELDGIRLSVANLHLPWDSARQKELQITAIDRYMHRQAPRATASVMLGDFNGGPQSSVHRYLLGEQTLQDCEARPYWFELSGTYAAISGTEVGPTLDFAHNPRWKGRNTTETPYAADRIYVLYNRGRDTLRSVRLFGTEVSARTGLAASDHYGVLAEIDFAH